MPYPCASVDLDADILHMHGLVILAVASTHLVHEHDLPPLAPDKLRHTFPAPFAHLLLTA